MKFVGLDGLKHFWAKAKSWIAEQITAEVTAKIAEIVAKAPEDLDTLKEIADWIKTHANDASAMNTAISTNASDIATLKTSVAGKSDTGHTHTKSEITDFPTSLPANGGTATKATQDGSGNVITSTYVKKSGDTLTSSTSDTPLYVNTTASGKTKSWIGFQIGSVSKNYIGADQNGLYSYTNSKNNKILDTSAQTLTDEEKTQVRSNIGAGTSSLTIGTTETTAAAGNHTHSGYLTAHQDISGKLNVDGSNATNTGTSAIVHSLDTATGDVTDDTEIITSNASGYSSSDTKYYKRVGSKVWNYIKSKISSVLGLTATNYGGKASTAGTADNAKRLKPFAYWDGPYVYDETNGVRFYVFKIQMVNWFNSILIQIYDDINYAKSRRYILGLWHVDGYGYSVSVTDLGGTKYNGLRVWLGNDGNVYLQAYIMWNSRISFSYLEDITNITVEKIGVSKVGSNKDIDGNVLFTPLTDPIIDCGAIRGESDLSSASISGQYLKANITGDVTGNLTGNAKTATSASKLTTARKTYVTLGTASTTTTRDWSGDTTIPVSGVLPVTNGGTGVTTQAEINKAFIANLDVGESDVTDGTEFVSSWASDNGFAETTEGAVNTPYKRKFSKVWNYIKDKISSVLGLTANNYGGKASTAGTADVANALSNRGAITNTDTFQNVMNNDGKWIITDLTSGWNGSLYSFYIGGSQSGLMFRIRGGSSDIRNVEVNYSIDSNRFVGSWHPLIGRIPIGAPSSPQDGDIWIES